VGDSWWQEVILKMLMLRSVTLEAAGRYMSGFLTIRSSCCRFLFSHIAAGTDSILEDTLRLEVLTSLVLIGRLVYSSRR
jgi:hypothetical protein